MGHHTQKTGPLQRTEPALTHPFSFACGSAPSYSVCKTGQLKAEQHKKDFAVEIQEPGSGWKIVPHYPALLAIMMVSN